jgi:hypothetical protein
MMKEIKARQERAAAYQEKMISEMETRAEAHHERFLAFLDRLTSYGKGTTTCQTEKMSCSEEMKATNLEATPEETEAAVELQDPCKEETNAENTGSLEDRYGEQRLAA